VSPEPDSKRRADAGLLKSAGIISAAVAASRVTGLLRESVLGSLFGASATFDAYVLGYRIPNLARDLFAEGALSSAFVPTFSRYLATKTREDARELSDITGTLLIIIVGAICAAGWALSPVFVTLFAADFHAVPGKFELAVSLVRIMFPFLLLVALAAQAQGILNACHQFGIPALSSSLFNIGSIVFGLAIGYGIGPHVGLSMVQGMACGVVFGGLAQLVFQLPSVWRAGFAWRPRLNLRHEGVRHILALMGPAVLGGASVQINVLVNTSFAAGLRDAAGHVMNGPVSWLSYAYRFMQLPIGVFGLSIASAALPRMSRSAAENDLAGFRDTLSRSIVMILLLTVPSSAGLMVFGESMVAIVYQHGRFLASDTHQTAIALTCYAAGLASYASLRLIVPAFYALGDSRSPMLVSMASVLVNAASSFTMVRIFGFGHAGLALSLTIVSAFNSLTLISLIRGRIGGIRGREISGSLTKMIAAATVMSGVCFGIVRACAHLGRWSAPVTVLVGIPAGAAVFYSVASALGIREVAETRDTVMLRLRGSR
jgi:putative peptidoglycan lipid II flippase